MQTRKKSVKSPTWSRAGIFWLHVLPAENRQLTQVPQRYRHWVPTSPFQAEKIQFSESLLSQKLFHIYGNTFILAALLWTFSALIYPLEMRGTAHCYQSVGESQWIQWHRDIFNFAVYSFPTHCKHLICLFNRCWDTGIPKWVVWKVLFYVTLRAHHGQRCRRVLLFHKKERFHRGIFLPLFGFEYKETTDILIRAFQAQQGKIPEEPQLSSPGIKLELLRIEGWCEQAVGTCITNGSQSTKLRCGRASFSARHWFAPSSALLHADTPSALLWTAELWHRSVTAQAGQIRNVAHS